MLNRPLLALAALFSFTTAFAGPIDTSKSGKTVCPAPLPEGVGPYVSLFGGLNLGQTADRAYGLDLDSEVAWFAGLKAGYTFEPRGRFQLALELDGSYVHDQFRGDEVIQNRVERLDIEVNREVHVAPILVNGLVKMEIGRFRPYVGGGIGAGYVRGDSFYVHHDHQLHDHFQYRDGSRRDSHGYTLQSNTEEWTFAMQGIAGAEYLVTPKLGVYLEYKALWLRDANDIKNYINHLLGAGVRVYF